MIIMVMMIIIRIMLIRGLRSMFMIARRAGSSVSGTEVGTCHSQNATVSLNMNPFSSPSDDLTNYLSSHLAYL
jgi:hypothetical protein